MDRGKMRGRAALQFQKEAGPRSLNCILLCMILSIQIQANLLLGVSVSSNALMG